MTLTKKDLKSIGDLLDEKLEVKLEEKLEQKLEVKLEEKLEVKLEEKLDTKLDQKLDEKLTQRFNSFRIEIKEWFDDFRFEIRQERSIDRSEFYAKIDPILKEVKASQEERKIWARKLAKHDNDIDALQTLHPNGKHAYTS